VGGAVGIAIGGVVVVAGVIVMVVKGLTGGVKSSTKLHPDTEAEYTDVEKADVPKQLEWETTNGPPIEMLFILLNKNGLKVMSLTRS